MTFPQCLMRVSILWGLSACAFAQADPPISLPAPDTPDALERRLAYAQSQAEGEGGDCAARLESVQAQLDIVTASPLLDVAVPDGRARLANIGYRLHLGRAYCGDPAAPRRDQLTAALEAARSAVILYRQGYDYQSMVVMQYDVATTYSLLGERDEAIAALAAAVGMDHEFGFADDAAENEAQLRRWRDPQGADVPPAAVPARSVTLKFAWAPLEEEVALKAEYRELVNGAVLHSSASATRTRHLRAEGGDWILSSEPGERRYDFAEWQDRPDPPRERSLVMLAADQMLEPDIRIGAAGDFKEVVDPTKTGGVISGDIDRVSGDLHVPEEDKLDLTELYGRSVELYIQPDGIKSRAAADYAIATATWIDATLEQGVWYDMTASLFVPGMAMWIDHDIQFTYARPVACTAGAAEASCAEILVHATPNLKQLEERIDHMKRALRLSGTDRMRYESATDLRLVVDPARLLPYTSEALTHWYFAIDGKGNPLIGSEKLVSTYVYR